VKGFIRILVTVAALAGVAAGLWFGPLTSAESRALGAGILQLDERLRPGDSERGEAFSTTLRIDSVEGLPDELVDRRLELAARSPDLVKLEAEVDGERYRVGRNRDELWIHVPHEEFAVRGVEDEPRFTGHPDSVEPVDLPDLRSPVPRWQLALLPALVRVERVAGDEGIRRARPRAFVADRLGWPDDAEAEWTTGADGTVSELAVSADGKKVAVDVESFRWLGTEEAETASWDLPAGDDTEVERVSASHLVRFGRVLRENLGISIEPLPPADGSREVVARHGKGRLERIDHTRVLFLEGTPEEMGEQHGTLLRPDVQSLVDHMVYGVGVGSSFDKGRWFFGEIEEAQRRLEPFVDERHLREMDALAAAADLHPQEARLANFFPALFHCSGFALHGAATAGERIYHGRVLDYLRGLGLEQNAVVMVVRPDEGNAWVNVGYAGFVGTVTAMNEKHVAIGEMGGRGEGKWDGKPMAQLMREVMERADTIGEAVRIMRDTPRTCEYYYVISDGKSGRAVGIAATPEKFETIWSGEPHPQLPRPVEDTVLMSAGDRYEALVDRVEAGYGSFDAESARALMDRPVCMTSNIQSVLFAPDTLDFWVANADSENVASHTRYTHYNLAELLASGEGGDEFTSASAGDAP